MDVVFGTQRPFMKTLPVICLLLLAVSLNAQSNLVAHIHFLGGDRIATDPGAAAFRDEFCSAEARALESQTLDKLARAFMASKTGATNEAATLLRPLLDDLLASEWMLEIRDGAHGPGYALAIRLNEDRAKLWNDNWQAVLRGWTDAPVSRVSRSGDWVVIDNGENQLSLAATAETNWLSADVDWPRLAQLFPGFRDFDFPKFAVHLVGRGGQFQIDGKLDLAQPLPALEPWRMPTNLIRARMLSFTAVRGAGPWLQKQEWFRPYAIQPQPDQLFIWAPQISFQTLAAEPVPDATAALASLRQSLQSIDWQNHFMMPLALSSTNDQLSVTGIPFYVLPCFQAVHEADGDFLLGGFFPNAPRGKAASSNLMTQLNTPNLVYYHQEATAERLKQVPQLAQLVLMLTKRQQLDGSSAGFKWLSHFQPGPDANVTQLTEATPSELILTRRSPTGLTAFELFMLADWLESSKFPAFDLSVPEPSNPRPHRKAVATPTMPAPPVAPQ